MLEKQKYIPSPQEFLEKIPMTPALKSVKERRDAEIRAVISGKSEKLLVIVGPCSAHAHAPTLNYITRRRSRSVRPPPDNASQCLPRQA